MPRTPTPLPIATFDLDCDLTIRPQRLAEQFKSKADRALAHTDLPNIDKVIKVVRTRWGGHTDMQVELTSLRVHQQKLKLQAGGAGNSPPYHVAVMGCGYMGGRIAIELARCGVGVTVFDTAKANAKPTLMNVISDAVHAKVMEPEHAENVAKRVAVSDSVADAVKDASLVVEAIIDDEEAKRNLYAEVIKYCRTDAVLGTTSMNLPLESVQALVDVQWRRRLIKLRFLAPVVGVSFAEVSHMQHAQNAEVKEVCDMFCSMNKTLVLGSRSSLEDPPYIGPGYETADCLFREGVTEGDLAAFPFRQNARKMVLGQMQQPNGR